MSDLKITIDQLKNYLGTGLKFYTLYDLHDEYYDFEESKGFVEAFMEGRLWELKGFSLIDIPLGEGELLGPLLQHEAGFYKGLYHDHKPLMYRLSDLDKFIPELGVVPLDEIAIYSPSQKDYLIDEILRGFVEYMIFEMIVKWNFWPFGDEYFEKGLVIDKLKKDE